MSKDSVVRAFLSHASEDKPFVESVASHLGRQYCLFDKYEFSSGVEFEASIDGALDKSGIFVLFASSISIRKYWVRYEMDGALARKVRGAIDRILVYITDGGLSVDDVPDDFKKAKIEYGMQPAQVARDIVMHCEEMLRLRNGKYYFGRGSDHDAFGRLLLRRIGGRAPNVFFVAGLPGIGRREFLRRAARDSLSLRKTVELRIGEGHTASDLMIQLVDSTGSFGDTESFNTEARRIKALDENAAIAEIVQFLRGLPAASELPILVDEGGVLTGDGAFVDWINGVFVAVVGRAGWYCGMVSNRKPQGDVESKIAFFRLNPISSEATKLLISQYSDDIELELSSAQVDEFSEYVAGYPPAAYYVVQQAKEYGVDVILRSKERLVEFRRKLFYDYIDRLNFSAHPVERKVLKLLSAFSPLPLAALGKCIAASTVELTTAVIRLVDLSLLSVEDGLYRISDPVSEAATKHFGLPSVEEAGSLAQSLKDYLASQDVSNRRLDVSRALFRASRLAGDDVISRGVIRLTSDLVGLVEELYHQRRYEEAVSTGVLAIAEAPRATVALSYLVRSFVQLERWDSADQWLEKYKALAAARDYYFLKAFMTKRQGKLREAIALYEQSKSAGKTGVSISRELSQCYALVGNYQKAREHLTEALAREPDNRYVVDLWATIAAKLGDREEAEKALARLEFVDTPMFFYFRKSRVCWVFGDADSALVAARESVKQDDRPTFQVLAQLALCEQVAGSSVEAERLIEKLDRDFASIKRDVRIGLRVRLMIAQSPSAAVLELLETTANKTSDSYYSLKRDVLQSLASSPQIPDSERRHYQGLAEKFSAAHGGLARDISELDIR